MSYIHCVFYTFATYVLYSLCFLHICSKMTGRGECLCRKGYVFWPLNGECYKAFTGGPCRHGQFLIPHNEDENIGKCVTNPCPRAHLYFPGVDFDSQIKCHKVHNGSTHLQLAFDA